MEKPIYRGRFAPSPTGELHFGSLVAAVGSYLDAKANRGEWIVRIEDIDETRCHPEYETSILKTLEAFGFEWDGPVIRQTDRIDAYRAVFDELKKERPCVRLRLYTTGNCRFRCRYRWVPSIRESAVTVCMKGNGKGMALARARTRRWVLTI